jgi:hypothetical protein
MRRPAASMGWGAALAFAAAAAAGAGAWPNRSAWLLFADMQRGFWNLARETGGAGNKRGERGWGGGGGSAASSEPVFVAGRVVQSCVGRAICGSHLRCRACLVL